MRVGVVSLGCAKNRVDTEEMLSLLSQEGYELTEKAEDAEVLVVNTCGFITSAKEESIDAIFEMAQYKETGKCRALVVTGCLAQRYGEDLMREIPQIDVLSGVTQYDTLAEAIGIALEKGERRMNTERKTAFLHCGRVLTTPKYTAYVRIGEGCDNRCAFCAIPLIRGRHHSRDMEDILGEMKGLSEQGVKEQILIAQDTTGWGRDLGPERLKDLLRRAALEVAGLEWLRVLYCYPDGTDKALIDEMAAHENICRYLDLPLQHASRRILKAMRRRGDIDQVREVLCYARSLGFALRTTFIVGFPGETEEDFEELMAFCRDMRFDRMGAFTFSPEEDTAAALMDGQIPEEEKKRRLDLLMSQQAGISRERNEARVGTVCRVLVTGRQAGLYTGRSAWEAPDADGIIRFEAKQTLKPGDFIDVRLTKAEPYDLIGAACEEPA
ncbi:MAG: 30S ribosomal protein S12 methylthiotransferase RimO [Clostridiales bacterium]|nr:30S ribosomal protein S12 methylthiotransferase RimO [Clostridiales bacterium]